MATAITVPAHWIALAILALLAGCNASEPKGQVVAVVNGEEVTIPELNAEARARGLAIGRDRDLRSGLVEDLVQRKLLVQEARRRGVDRNPQFLLAARRLDEMLLADELATSSVDRSAGPSDAEVAEYIRSKPQAFGQRMLWSVEHLSFGNVQAPRLARTFEESPSLQTVERFLREAGIDAVRRKELWDSATMPAEWHRQLLAAAPGDSVLLRRPDRTVAVQLQSASAYPVPEDQQRTFARQMIRQERRQATLQHVLEQARSKAKIEYQDGFAP